MFKHSIHMKLVEHMYVMVSQHSLLLVHGQYGKNKQQSGMLIHGLLIKPLVVLVHQ